MQYKIRRNLCMMLAAALLLTGCAPAEAPPSASPTSAADIQLSQDRVTDVGYYFNTVVTITLYAPQEGLVDEIWAECARYESMLSKTVSGSDVQKINAANGQTVTVSPDTWEILRRAKEISRATGGAFSITVAPLTAMWDFTHGTQRMPTDEERIAALPLVNDEAIVLGEGYTVTLPAGMEIDLGGIAKGYIADCIARLVASRCDGAVLSFGGNIYVTGHKPGSATYGVGIQDPQGDGGTSIAVLRTTDTSIVTSGVYERYFILDGIRYHHILDPYTGLPADSGLASATVVNESSMTADAIVTACIVLGPEKSLQLLEQLGLDGLLIGNDQTIYTTEGFDTKYQLQLLQNTHQ